MIDITRVYPECFADTLLAEIVLQHKPAFHYRGISEVSKAMQRYGNTSHTIVGLLDGEKFKNEDTYLKSFIEIERRAGVVLLQIPDYTRYLIKLLPSFEDWILTTGALCGIMPENYKYSDIQRFKRDCKREDVHKNQEIRNMLKAIVRADPEPVKALREWLHKIAEN